MRCEVRTISFKEVAVMAVVLVDCGYGGGSGGKFEKMLTEGRKRRSKG